jgi:hypothetical protein
MKRGFEEHNDNVRRAAKAAGRDLLEYGVQEGWEPLCKFLEVPIPDTKFPRVNDSAAFLKQVRWMRNLAILKMAGKGLVYIAPVMFGLWYLPRLLVN